MLIVCIICIHEQIFGCHRPSSTGFKDQVLRLTSICRRVFATSSGHVAADAKVPATKPAEKFTPRTVAALGSSPISPRIFFLICMQTQINTCTKKYPKLKIKTKSLFHFIINYNKILLAQGLPSKSPSMEHP